MTTRPVANGFRALVLTPEAFGGRGGIAQYNRDFLSALCSMPDCVDVVALPRLMRDSPGSLPLKLDYRGEALNNKLAYFKAVLCVAKGRFDIVICSHVNLLPLAVLASWLCRAPLCLLVYGIDVWTPHRSRLARWALRAVDWCVSISETTRDKFTAWSRFPQERIQIAANAIHMQRYGTGPKSPVLLKRYGLDDKRVLLTMGRLSADERYKGLDEVMEVLPALRKRDPRLSYLIVGDGNDRERLERKARALNVSDMVVFAGYIDESEKADHFRLADAYAMPGRGEGFGFVFLEAMACGIPVVASRLDGSREAVRDGALGAAVNPDDREELLDAILTALEQPKRIPAGLEFFSYSNFERQVHAAVSNTILAGRHA